MAQEQAAIQEGDVITIGLYQSYDLVPKYGAPLVPNGTQLVVIFVPENKDKTKTGGI